MLIPYAAYLRVYEPLPAFAEPQRAAWAAYADGADVVGGQQAALAEERQAGLASLLARPPLPAPVHESPHAFVLRQEGTLLVCPWESRLRCWTALREFLDGLPEPAREVFFPRVVVEQAEADFTEWRRENPDAVPHILTATWHVPLRWFVLFRPDERILDLGNAGEPGAGSGSGRTLVYRTAMARARQRVARGLRTLQRTVEDGPVVAGVEDLARWLEAFHPRSVVELDYGGLVHLLDDATLTADRSTADVAEALAALAAGEPSTAAVAYERLVERWRGVQAREHAN